MSLINAEGDYRGKIVDGGFSESSGGFPQEVLAVTAVEVYDSDNEQWLPADQENNEITSYTILYDGKDKKTLGCKQLQKITGWDGASFKVLSEMNLADVPIQFRVEPRTYKDNTTLQVTWISEYDAAPGRTVQKLDKEGVAGLQARYAGILAANKGPVTAVSAPKTKTAPAVAKTVAQKPPARPQVSKPRPSAPKAKSVASGGRCTADEAWDACALLKRDDITEERLGEIWLVKIDEVTKGKAEDKITTSDWFKIKELVQKETSKV